MKNTRTMPSRIVCFVCGSLGGEYQLRSRPYEGCAFFPFLEHHDPPKGSRIPGPDGIVDSCRVCYAFLTQQWETYERTNTPAIKRLYWLKRLDDGQFTGAEMKLQGEYMAQVMGLQYQPSCGDSCAPGSPDSRDGSGTGAETDVRMGRKSQAVHDDRDGVLDLSVPVKSDVAHISNKLTPAGDKCSREATKLRPQLDDFSFICYICGDDSEGVAAKCISSMPHGANKPFFPFLTKITPPKGAPQLNGQGICQVCDRCFSSLCHQWLTYEHHGTPNSARIFKVNTQFFSSDANIALGLVPDALSASGEVCYLCSRSWASSKVCSLYTAPASSRGDQMYFPFIRELRRPHGARPLNPDGSVLVCVSCYSNLQDQWQRYEAEKVPFLQRRYSLLPPSSSTSSVASLSLKPFADSDIKCDPGMLKIEGVTKSVTQPLAIDISKSAMFAKNQSQSLSSGTTSYSSAAVVVSASTGSNQVSAQDSSRHHITEAKSHSSSTILSIPHPLQQAGERPKKVCFLCGQKCLLSKAQILYSYPVRHETKSSGAQCQTIPFFPFLASQPPAPGSEPMTEEGTVISCSYCFYSLLNQWRDFEESKGVTDRNRWLRKYTLNEFVCYVCGMMVPRKKMRTLEVHKFLFLREHKAPPNALVMWGGEGVGACGSCHYSLSHQFTEFERLGLPMELRKYNWTVQHHTEENSNDAHDSNHGVLSAAINEDSNLSVADGADDSNHSSALSTKPVFSLVSPASNFGKTTLKSALVLPQNRMSPSNGLTSSSHNLSLSTSRTAGFAAALRSLAHQIKEPGDDENCQTSPTNHNSRSNTPKRTQASLMLPSHAATMFTSPPVVTVAPTQTSMFQGVTSFSMGQERSHTSTFEPWSKPDPDLPSLPTVEGELVGKDLLHSRTSARAPAPRSVSAGGVPVTSQMLYARNFPAYRPEEEELMRHGLPLSYGIDPASYAAAAAATAYHPALLQQQAAFAQGSLRLGDTLLLDQYRMLQSPYLSFPAAGLISPHSLGIGMHSVLAAAAASQHYPPALFPQHYPYLSLGQPMMDPQASAQAVAMDRSWLDAEKARDKKERERPRHQEHSHEKEVNHRMTGSGGEQNFIKKEENSISESFRDGSLERKNTPSVPICLSSHSPELSSHQYNESHNGHPSSRPTSSMSVSSGQRPVSKVSHGAISQATETLLEKSSQPSLSFGTSHASLKSHDSILPSRGLTFKPYEKLCESRQHPSRPLLDQHEESALPSWIRSSSSSSSSAHDKNKNNSDVTPLFRPFDDNKDTVDFTSVAAQTVHSRHRQWSLDNSSSMLPFHLMEPNTNSSAVGLPGGVSDACLQTSPLNSDAALVPNNCAMKQPENCFTDRIKRFDFKSLAHECTSSSLHYQPNVNSCNMLAAAESKQYLSKLDFEAARAKERRRRGEDTDSDSEKEKEERMRVRLTMVGRATPIPLDTSLTKMEFLENVGLTSWKRKKELNRQKEIRRRRQLRLSSISPIQHEADGTLEFPRDNINSLSHHSTHSLSPHNGAVSTDVENSGMDLGEKSEFVTRLGLMSVNENQKVAAHGAKRKLGEADRPLENLAQKKASHETSEQTTGRPDDGYLNQFTDSLSPSSQRRTQYPDTSKKTSVHLGTSQRQGHSRLLGSGDCHQALGATAHSLMDPGALLPSAMPLTSRKASSFSEHQDSPWPGVEGLMESYQRHREEQLAESQILRQRCRQLQASHQDLAQVAHRVNRRMTYLMEERQRLMEERLRYQDTINHLKETFSDLK